MVKSPAADTARNASDFRYEDKATWRRLFGWILTPVDVIEESQRRRQARIHALLLAVLVPLAFLAAAWGILEEPAATLRSSADLDQAWVTAGGLLLLCGSFVMVRAGLHRSAAILTIATTFATVWVLWVIDARAPGFADVQLLYYLGLPILLASLILSLWNALAVLGVNVAVAPFVLSAAPDVARDQVTYIVAFLGVTSAVALTLAALQYRDTQTLQAQAYRLSEAERHRMESVNALAHDLASPLSPINMQIHLLKSAAEDDGRAAEALPVIQRNLAHVQGLLKDWREVVEAQTGRVRARMALVDLTAVARDVAGALATSARDAHLKFSVDALGPVWVNADPARMRDVLYNLITNAIKYTPGGGKVTVSVQSAAQRARVTITDTGIGIDADKLPLLFRAFSQVHDQDKIRVKSTGLGLYISKQVVEAHGGRIWASSAGRGAGSTFAFEMPSSGPDGQAAAVLPAADADETRPSVQAKDKVVRTWDAFTRPSDAIEDAATARRARLLASVLLVIVPVGAIAGAYTAEGSPVDAVMAAALLVLILAYGVSRTRHQGWAVGIVIAAVMVAIWGIWALIAAQADDHGILFFLAYAVLLAVPFLGLRSLMALAGANLAPLIAAPWIAGATGLNAPDFDTQTNLVLFYLFFSALSVAAFSLTRRNQDHLVRQSQAIDATDAARARLSGRIAEALARPLDAVRRELPDAPEWNASPVEERRSRLDRAHVNVRRMERLIDDLKELAKLDAGRIVPESKPTRVRTLHENAGRLVAATLRDEKGAPVLEGDDPIVLADSTLTVKAFYYLMRFALQQTVKADGAVTAWAAADGKEASWGLRVPGSACDPDMVDRLLSPLAALDEPTPGGIDLGLYVAKRILELSRSRLEFQWSEGRPRMAIHVGLPRPVGEGPIDA